jgi:serine/threonine protein phosphatase PrpC
VTRTVTVYKQPQESDTPTRSIRTGTLVWRYAYARSEECRAAGEPGQDYLSLKVAPPTFVFALCDGVSQSFFGDLAARLLGDSLVDWLWQSLSEDVDAPRFARELAEHLSTLVHAATEQVQAFRLPLRLTRSCRRRSQRKTNARE